MSKKTFYVCSHTHWDREWYGSYQEFRMRLVRLMDKLINLFKKNPKYKYFNLDGQTIVLNDYLEIRPENRNVLKRLISSGKLIVGPWYILPDEFLVSGEATIRNLLLGKTIAEGFGKKSVVGYLPDMFGHISQMPQILKGFGMDVAIIWRGLSWKKYQQELLWESPDKTRVLAYHLPSCGYANVAFFVSSVMGGPFRDKLPLNLKKKLVKRINWNDMLVVDEAVEYMKVLANEMPKYAMTNCFLLMNGVDHMEPQEKIPEIIERANKGIPNAKFVHSTFDQFSKALTKDVSTKKNKLPIKKGILRDTMLYKEVGGYVLNGVLSSRIYLKIKNQECQNILEKWIEPFSSISTILGISYQKELIWKAWEYLLQNHPHDDICGCSVDSVHRQMETRFEFVNEITKNLLNNVFYGISSKINTSSFISDGESGFVVFNSIQKDVSGLLDIEIPVPISKLKELKIDNVDQIKSVEVYNSDGNRVMSQIGRIKTRNIAKYYKEGFSPIEEDIIVPAKIWMGNVPSLGYKTFKLKFSNVSRNVKQLNLDNKILENKFIRAVIKSNGTIDLLDKQTGKLFKNIHYFEDGGDNGDTYNYSYLKKDKIITTLKSSPKIELIEDGDVCKAYCITHKIKLPQELASDFQSRSLKYVDYKISTVVKLGVFSKRLEFETTVENNVKDHRLRVCFPTNLKTKYSEAEAQFDVVKHSIHIKQPSKNVWIEDQPREYPQQTFVDVSDGKHGFGVINFGLPEYEVLDNSTHTICLTLLRAVGYLSNNRLNTRKNGAGPETFTPDAQCQRKFVFRYAVFLHKGCWNESDLQDESHEFNNGFFVFNVDRHKGLLPLEKSFIKIDGKNVILSTIKKAEKDDALIIRVWNSGNRETSGTIKFGFDIKGKICYCNFAERDIKTMNEIGNRINFEILPKQIKTFKIYLSR